MKAHTFAQMVVVLFVVVVSVVLILKGGVL